MLCSSSSSSSFFVVCFWFLYFFKSKRIGRFASYISRITNDLYLHCLHTNDEHMECLDGAMKNYALIEFQILPIRRYAYIALKTKANCTLASLDWKSKSFWFSTIEPIICSVFIHLLIVLPTNSCTQTISFDQVM